LMYAMPTVTLRRTFRFLVLATGRLPQVQKQDFTHLVNTSY